MASLRRRNSGWEIQYKDEYRRKKTITLSAIKFTERTARQLRDAVEVLLDKRINNDPKQHTPTKAWVEKAAPEIRVKLARLGLYDMPSKHTTEELWDTFLAKHSDMYEDTLRTYRYAKNRFFLFFKPAECLDELTKRRMADWRHFLLASDKYVPATIAGTISKAKAVFNWAKEERWIKVSPLDGVGRGSYRNREKDRFITQEEYRQLLDAATCQEWRVTSLRDYVAPLVRY